MSEIGTQLRTYFDETVERTTEEDVRVRATTARGVPVASPRFRPRPLAAGAIGFGLAMTLLGVVLVVDRVFGAGVSDVGGGGGGSGTVGVTPGSEQGSLWLFIPVVFGIGMLATGIISARRRNGDMRERGEWNMETIETVETVETPLDKQILTLKKRDRRLAWLAGILAVIAVVLGAWLIAEVTSSGASMPGEVRAVIDDYNSAWMDSDRTAFLEATTEDYTFVANGQTTARASQAGLVSVSGYFRVETDVETIMGDGPYYIGSAQTVFTSASSTGFAGQSILTIVEVDGAWKVSQHTWIGEL